jgi:F-type H+-transporting ATPase subunit epsilon
MQLDIITPEKILFSASISMVGIPGMLGDFGVLPGHAPFISTIRPGVITIDSEDGGTRKLAVMSGIAEVVPEHCIILAENVVDCAELTASYVEEKALQAEDDVEAASSESARKLAETKRLFAEVLRQQIG